MSSRRYALVAGGGTGGHVVPAIAVAAALADGRGADSVELVGSRRGLDSSLVRGSGLLFTLLPGRGFRRRADLKSVLDNVVALGQLLVAVVLAFGLVARRRPAVVVAMGGYGCVASALAARLLAVPVVLVNVDAVPGAANRLVGRFASVSAVAFEGTRLPRAVVTGTPVREEILAVAHPDLAARLRAREALEVPPDRQVVAVVGGSLGARRINEAVVGVARMWRARADLALYHVIGARDYRWVSDEQAELEGEGLWYRQVEFESRMPLFYQAADVVVCRAGANTVAELTVVGVPALVVPLPNSPGDHQAANAAVLADAGAAVVVVDEECEPKRVASELDRILGDSRTMQWMRKSSEVLGRPDALGAVVSVVEEQARADRAGTWPALGETPHGGDG